MKTSLVVVLVLQVVVMGQDLFGEEGTEASTKWWIHGGVGYATLGSIGGALGVNVQLKNVLLTLRVAGGQDSLAFGLTDADVVTNELSDTAIMVGLVSENRKRHASFSIGVARVTGSYEEKNVATVGFPLQTQLFLKATRVLGIGLNIFANVNREQSFGGIALSLNLGRLR